MAPLVLAFLCQFVHASNVVNRNRATASVTVFNLFALEWWP